MKRIHHEKLYEIPPCYALRHQFDGDGHHRLVVTDVARKTGTASKQSVSAWYNISKPATCINCLTQFVATTPLWSKFPRVFKVEAGHET